MLLGLKALVVNAGSTPQRSEMVLQRGAMTDKTLASIGPIRRWLFRKLLSWAQNYGPYREEALFYIGAAWPTLRGLALELGCRLVEIGTLRTPDDIFYLNSDEIVRACTSRQQGKAVNDLGFKANQRRELREARRKLHPPPMVPEGRFKIGPFDLSFIETQKRNRDDSNTLNGFAVSPGKVTGTATVIMSPADFESMKPGTILVCPTTTPAWTPFFSQAQGTVPDIGGSLPHWSSVSP